MSEQKRKYQKIYDLLNAEINEKKSEIIRFFHDLNQAQFLTPLIMLYLNTGFLKTAIWIGIG